MSENKNISVLTARKYENGEHNFVSTVNLCLSGYTNLKIVFKFLEKVGL